MCLLRPENVLLVNAMGAQPSQGPLAIIGTQASLHIQHRGQIQWAGCALVPVKTLRQSRVVGTLM